jgi:hypothetical protein
MRFFELDFSLITGCMLGFEWAPKGLVEEDFGHLVFDVLIFRLIITYN